MYSLTTDVTANNLDIRTKWHGLTASSSVFDVCVSHNVRISHNVTYHNNEQFAIHTSIMAENNLLNYDCGITLCVLTAWRCYCDSCTTFCWNPACMAKGHHQHHTWRYHPIRLQSEIVILINFSFYFFIFSFFPEPDTQTANTSSSYLLLTACVRLGFEADFQRMCSLTTDITANNSDIEFRLHQLTVLLSISDGCVNSCCLPQQTYWRQGNARAQFCLMLQTVCASCKCAGAFVDVVCLPQVPLGMGISSQTYRVQ